MTADALSCEVAAVFVQLADTLVEDYDVVEVAALLAAHSVALLGVDAAGVMSGMALSDLGALSWSDGTAEVLQRFEARVGQGPGLDAYHAGELIDVRDLTVEMERWPLFAPYAVEQGIRGVTAVPMWVRNHRIGVLNLYRRRPRSVPREDLMLAQGLADIASIGIISAERFREQHVLAEQLHNALESRIVIEQAKGMLAGRLGIGVDGAFDRMRGYARSHRRRLSDVARDIVSGAIPPTRLEDPLEPHERS